MVISQKFQLTSVDELKEIITKPPNRSCHLYLIVILVTAFIDRSVTEWLVDVILSIEPYIKDIAQEVRSRKGRNGS